MKQIIFKKMVLCYKNTSFSLDVAKTRMFYTHEKNKKMQRPLFVVLIFSITEKLCVRQGFIVSEVYMYSCVTCFCVSSASSLVSLHLQFLALLTRMAARKQPWTAPTPEVSAVVQEVVVEDVAHCSDEHF